MPRAKQRRSTKIARKVIQNVTKQHSSLPSQRNQTRVRHHTSLDEIEIQEATARKDRVKETQKRNAVAQNYPDRLHKKVRRGSEWAQNQSNQDSDAKAFFADIDAPLLKICGSCGELTNSTRLVKTIFNPQGQFLAPLRNAAGICEIITEAITKPDVEGSCYILLCCRCNAALLKRQIPKFSISSGFRIASIPSELAILNRMEARLIGLGISFTTCVNLYKDQQEFTRGNAINYWNDIHQMTLSLPRPLTKSGIVLLQSKNDQGKAYFRVRPHLIRKALQWLIVNNPLYKNVTISEENLTALDAIESSKDIPQIPISEEEANGLNPERGNHSVDSVERKQNKSRDSFDENLTVPACDDVAEKNTNCESIFIEESFELEADSANGETEAEKILSAVNNVAGNQSYPTGELNSKTELINEYSTEMLMQSCFPTLFPDGRGGLNPIQGTEERLHTYKLAEYCAHLMKYHDRRFVIHGNFKFFCLNLIQRRQIDGLVRRINLPSSIDLNDADSSNIGCSEGVTGETQAAMKLLDSLKPFFRGVRGSGLYWSNARDDLMSMIGSKALPTRWPTFFLTLSAADTIWPDFFRACDPSISLDEARNLSSTERRRYLSENPDIAARHFSRRFSAFFKHVLCGTAKPLGEIVDYFWRVEFQHRGSPHIHALLWVKNAPDVLQLSESCLGRSQLAGYADSVICVLAKTSAELESCTCSTCTCESNNELDILSARPPNANKPEWECDLSRVVNRVQQHICNTGSPCRKRGDECRFGYPKEIRQQTEIEVSDIDDGVPSIQIHLKREVPTINNYSPVLLSSWRANMDIQLIGNAYGAAEYTAAYVSKAEPDTQRFRKVITGAVKRCDPHLPNYAILKRVANATLSIREVSAQEAYYILLRELPLYGKSRQITRVKVMRHNLRYYRVETSDFQAIERAINTRDSIRIEAVEKAYMARPVDPPFEAMTFATFVEKYEFVDKMSSCKSGNNHWKRLDGEGFIKLRSNPHVARPTPWIAPDSTNPNYCFSELFLHKSWHSLAELPQTDDACLALFEQEQQRALESEFRQESSLKSQRQRGLEALKKKRDTEVRSSLPPSDYVFIDSDPNPDEIYLVRTEDTSNTSDKSNPNQNIPSQWTGKHAYTSEDVSKAKEFIKTHVKPWLKLQRDVHRCRNKKGNRGQSGSHYNYPIFDDDINESVSLESMHESQWIPFAFAMAQSRLRHCACINNSICAPMQMIIHGEGGSGKSWLIKHIVKDLHNVFSEHSASRRTSKRALLLAHQGTAAFNIKGKTICSALELSSFSRSAFSTPYTPLTTLKGGPAKLKRLQEVYTDVHLVIIDEFSVISCGMLFWIDQRMREIWPRCSHLPFGGRDLIFTGDFAQLDPVIPYALSTPTTKILNPSQLRGRELWTNIPIVCSLTSQNRGKTDPEWFDALRRLRSKCPTQADVDLFNTRYFKESEIPIWTADAKHIAYRNEDVSNANNHSLGKGSQPVVHIRSKHSVKLKRLAKKRNVSTTSTKALLDDAESPNPDRDRVVGRFVNLAVGAPVTLTFNLEQAAGLCNGTNGVIYDFIFSADMDLPIILVQMLDMYVGPSFLPGVANIIPVVPRKVSWGKKTSDLTVCREGIPLRLAYAITVHKVQGLTCDKVVFHSLSIPSASFAYVALSRVRSREDIVLTVPLTLAKLKTSTEKLANYTREEQRIQLIVKDTQKKAGPLINTMKTTALQHNRSLAPR